MDQAHRGAGCFALCTKIKDNSWVLKVYIHLRQDKTFTPFEAKIFRSAAEAVRYMDEVWPGALVYPVVFG